MDATCEEICMGEGVDLICIYVNTRISTYAIYPLMHYGAGHSTHFQVGGDNSKVEGGILQNQYVKQSRTLLSL
jgi:hypothetical protein